mmetsp:Transcript_32217/g.102701  ORF Transcript_32217/g.102701 Transcript_32217/m.102701 type:complete len:310 (-) Transcript_32217:124-1053(-)
MRALQRWTSSDSGQDRCTRIWIRIHGLAHLQPPAAARAVLLKKTCSTLKSPSYPSATGDSVARREGWAHRRGCQRVDDGPVGGARPPIRDESGAARLKHSSHAGLNPQVERRVVLGQLLRGDALAPGEVNISLGAGRELGAAPGCRRNGLTESTVVENVQRQRLLYDHLQPGRGDVFDVLQVEHLGCGSHTCRSCASSCPTFFSLLIYVDRFLLARGINEGTLAHFRKHDPMPLSPLGQGLAWRYLTRLDGGVQDVDADLVGAAGVRLAAKHAEFVLASVFRAPVCLYHRRPLQRRALQLIHGCQAPRI